MPWSYNADTYCDDCGAKLADELDAQGVEDTGDSNDYPQGADDDEADTPQHCGDCHAFLENPLTDEGQEYVLAAVEGALEMGNRESVAVTEWAPFYGIQIPDGYHDCECCSEIMIDGGFRCDACCKAGCERNREGYYDDCQIPRCPDCDERASLMSDGRWHPNCEPDECERATREGNGSFP